MKPLFLALVLLPLLGHENTNAATTKTCSDRSRAGASRVNDTTLEFEVGRNGTLIASLDRNTHNPGNPVDWGVEGTNFRNIAFYPLRTSPQHPEPAYETKDRRFQLVFVFGDAENPGVVSVAAERGGQLLLTCGSQN